MDEAEKVYTLPDHALSAVLNSFEKQAKERDIKFKTIIKSTTEKNRGIMRIIPHETCFEINCFIPIPNEGGETVTR